MKKGISANIRVYFTAVILSLTGIADVFAGTLSGKVVDSQNSSPLPFAIISVTENSQKRHSTTADSDGNFSIQVADGKITVTTSYLGYKTDKRVIVAETSTKITVRLVEDTQSLNEVYVTAKSSQNITTSSVIDRKAIEHLQPSSFTDLLSLLPGGSTALPNLTNANSIRLRQAGSGSGNYDISSLGTVFITDGIPINSNANMQIVKQASSSSYGDPDAGRSHTSTGIDMRQISTDNIESVEVIQGIAPVEYGDMTSGAVIIKRKLQATPFEARFKADSYSKLLYAGKGVEKGNFVTNIGLDYLDAKADPRNSLNNYKRLTLSARLQNTWNLGGYSLRWRSNTDYTGSFDNEKHDPEILKQKDDKYKSSYNKISMSHSLLLKPSKATVSERIFTFNSLNFDIAAMYERNRIEQTKAISLSRDVAVSTSLQDGEHDGVYLPYHYIADVDVDGRPLNLYSKLKALMSLKTGRLNQNFNVGVEFKSDKNYGNGQQYDPSRPIYPGTPYRPRIYKNIPAEVQLSSYVSDNLTLPVSNSIFNAQIGIRTSQMLNLDKKFTMRNRIYADPRVNLQWKFPKILIGDKPLSYDLNAGWGRHTKFPTLLQLYPDLIYNDIIELNYYDVANKDYSRFHLRTYIIDPTNYDLRPARNDKWEIRLGAEYDGYNFSATYFKEVLDNGFRTSGVALPFSYKDYDENSINPSELTSQPILDNIDYVDKTILELYGKTTNGSRLVKQGVEYQLSTKRFNSLMTRFTVNGAYFRTTYANSEPMFMTNTSQVVGGVPVNDLYIGFYDNSTATVREQFNTNMMADTYLPRLGLSFSLTAEATWFYSSQAKRENGRPLSYMATDGKIYPYTDESLQDPYLQWLEKKYAETSWLKQKVPFWLFVNLKVTKNFGQWMRLALFIDRMLDYMPDYTTVSGLKVRRTSKPYFGMEINFSI